jgi:hypothetical protein
MERVQGPLAGHCYHLHGLTTSKKKEVTALIEDLGGAVTYIFGKTVHYPPLPSSSRFFHTFSNYYY